MKSANFYNSTERTQQFCEQRFGDSGEEEHSWQKVKSSSVMKGKKRRKKRSTERPQTNET